jgi:striatin 1/3/4
MRFLQTEWHRHERDRNAWEIERQEMRARIASLEGGGRRADVQQKGLKKYVKMLEGALASERKKQRALNGVQEEDQKAPAVEKTAERRELLVHLVMV